MMTRIAIGGVLTFSAFAASADAEPHRQPVPLLDRSDLRLFQQMVSARYQAEEAAYCRAESRLAGDQASAQFRSLFDRRYQHRIDAVSAAMMQRYGTERFDPGYGRIAFGYRCPVRRNAGYWSGRAGLILVELERRFAINSRGP